MAFEEARVDGYSDESRAEGPPPGTELEATVAATMVEGLYLLLFYFKESLIAFSLSRLW